VVAISRRHFGLRGMTRAAAPAEPVASDIRAASLQAQRFTRKQIKTGLVSAAIVFIIVAKLAWAYSQYQVMTNASAETRRACAGASLKSLSSDAYYYCIERVQAGGEP